MTSPATHTAQDTDTPVCPWPAPRQPEPDLAAEAALRATANLATVGRLAVGVAHDFNNLLGVIVASADLLREALPADDPRAEHTETIARTSYTLAALGRQLIAVGRAGEPDPGPLDAAGAVRELEPMLRCLTGRHAALSLDLAPGLPPVRADATDFDRVLLNLVLNARDASRPGGAVTVRIAPAPGGGVVVAVADRGCGMTADVRARMFDLFFTTKGDRGTGLGLAAVRDAVSAAGGHIEVESEPGRGTTVRVFWPGEE